MYAEARSQRRRGMAMVGQVALNRLHARCGDFKKLYTLQQVLYHKLAGSRAFAVVPQELIAARPTEEHREIARELLRGGPLGAYARNALWFHNPSPSRKVPVLRCPPYFPTTKTKYLDKYLHHCFYAYKVCQECPELC